MISGRAMVARLLGLGSVARVARRTVVNQLTPPPAPVVVEHDHINHVSGNKYAALKFSDQGDREKSRRVRQMARGLFPTSQCVGEEVV